MPTQRLLIVSPEILSGGSNNESSVTALKVVSRGHLRRRVVGFDNDICLKWRPSDGSAAGLGQLVEHCGRCRTELLQDSRVVIRRRYIQAIIEIQSYLTPFIDIVPILGIDRKCINGSAATRAQLTGGAGAAAPGDKCPGAAYVVGGVSDGPSRVGLLSSATWWLEGLLV